MAVNTRSVTTKPGLSSTTVGETKCEQGIDIAILALSGATIANLRLDSAETVFSIKQAIQKKDCTKPACWQRLLNQNTELNDLDPLSAVSADNEAAAPLCLTLIVAVDPGKLLYAKRGSTAEVAEAFEAMGGALAPHVARLFTDEQGDPLSAPLAEELLDTLGDRLGWSQAYRRLRQALVPHAMDVLGSKEAVFLRSGRVARLFNWLGALAAPHISAWLILLERPLKLCLVPRVEKLGRFHECARVRLSAKSALRDTTGVWSTERVEEIARLCGGLGRDIKNGPGELRDSLEELLSRAKATLHDLSSSDDALVRYAATRALKKK